MKKCLVKMALLASLLAGCADKPEKFELDSTRQTYCRDDFDLEGRKGLEVCIHDWNTDGLVDEITVHYYDWDDCRCRGTYSINLNTGKIYHHKSDL